MNGSVEDYQLDQDNLPQADDVKQDVTLDESKEAGLIFREVTSDVTSSVAFICRRSQRNYISEFILPDETRVSVSRREINEDATDNLQITLNLSTGAQVLNEGLNSILKTSDTHGEDGGDIYNPPIEPCLQTFSENGQLNASTSSGRLSLASIDCPEGLRLVDYLTDDPWAASLTVIDASAGDELLRQLETSCRLEPDAYRMERRQRRRNVEVIFDSHKQPMVQSITLTRNHHDDTDSIDTKLTTLNEEESD